MDLYVAHPISILSALLALGLLVLIAWTASQATRISRWGRRIAGLSLLGLLACMAAAWRDAYHLSVQAAADSALQPGLFALDSVQSTLGCLGGAAIAVCCLLALFSKRLRTRRAVFFILAAIVVTKIGIVEVSRILL
jgi:hypothetical protein